MGRARSGYTKSDWYDGLELDPGAKTIVLERNDVRNDVRNDKLRSMMAFGVGELLLSVTFLADILSMLARRIQTSKTISMHGFAISTLQLKGNTSLQLRY